MNNSNFKPNHYVYITKKGKNNLIKANMLIPQKKMKMNKFILLNPSANQSPRNSFKKVSSSLRSTIHSSMSSISLEPNAYKKKKSINLRLSSSFISNPSIRLSNAIRLSLVKQNTMKSTKSQTQLMNFQLMNDAIEYDAKLIKKQLKKMIPQYDNIHNRSHLLFIDHKDDFEVCNPSIDKNKILFTKHGFYSSFVIKNHADLLLYWDQYSKMRDTDFYMRRKDIIKKFDILEEETNTNDDKFKDKNNRNKIQRKSLFNVRKNTICIKQLSHLIEQKIINLNYQLKKNIKGN